MFGHFNVERTYEPSWLENININLRSIERIVNCIKECSVVNDPNNRKAWALKALTLTDLTTLSGDDTKSNVQRLCIQAAYPFPDKYLRNLEENVKSQIHTAAVCVYPSRIADALEMLKQIKKTGEINIAAVATGFPSGQYPLKSRLIEIEEAIKDGANEIDVVVDRNLVLNNRWYELYHEIVQMRQVCGNKAHLKTILAIGECGTMENVYKTSMVAMMAGSDFIKTSTGKENVNATLPVGLVMIRAVEDFYNRTNYQIGLKPAGGVRTVQDAIYWLTLIKETLGDDWITPELFRFGASGLLDDIEKVFTS